MKLFQSAGIMPEQITKLRMYVSVPIVVGALAFKSRIGILSKPLAFRFDSYQLISRLQKYSLHVVQIHFQYVEYDHKSYSHIFTASLFFYSLVITAIHFNRSLSHIICLISVDSQGGQVV